MRFADVTSLSLSCCKGDVGSVRASSCPGSRISVHLSHTDMDTHTGTVPGTGDRGVSETVTTAPGQTGWLRKDPLKE